MRAIYINHVTTPLAHFSRVLLTAPRLGATTPKTQEEDPMSSVKEFEKAVTDAGAVAMRITRRANGSERLVIQTPGGLITREVPLRGDFSADFEAAATSAREIVASANHLTSPPARNLTSRTAFDRSGEPLASLPRSTRRR
jgi:hypothetical protein